MNVKKTFEDIVGPKAINVLPNALKPGKKNDVARDAIASRDAEQFFSNRKETEGNEVLFKKAEQKEDAQTIILTIENDRRELPPLLSGVPIFDISRQIDSCVKNYSTKDTGLVIVSVDHTKDMALAFMEFENNAAIDLHNHLKSVAGRINKAKHGKTVNISHILSQYLPLPFQGKQLNYGTWGRPALINNDPHFMNPSRSARCNVMVHIVDAYVETFDIRDKKGPGFYTSDITDMVQKVAAKSGKKNGIVVVTTQHTTVGITTTKPEDVKKIQGTLMNIAPTGRALYKHNKIDRKGNLKKDKNGLPLGDGNGQSHVQASLIGSFTAVHIKNGKLDIGRRRIYSMDCDVLPPRKRRIVVSVVENGYDRNAAKKPTPKKR